MRKRLFLLVLAAALILTAVGISASSELPFTDVKEGAWYYDYVKSAYENGYVNGMTATTYEPSSGLTRAQFVTILGRIQEAQEADDTPFTDISSSTWYRGYAGWAAEAGIVSGYEDGTFRGNNLITRQELMTMTSRFLDYAWVILDDSAEAVDGFADENRIASWAKEHADSMRRAGLVQGDEKGNFNPKKTATRAEAATILVRLVSAIDSSDKTPQIAGNALSEYSVTGDILSDGTKSEIYDAIKDNTGQTLTDGRDRHITFSVDESLMRLQYKVAVNDGEMAFSVSTEFASEYFPRIVNDVFSKRSSCSVKEGFSEEGTYTIDSCYDHDTSDIRYLFETDRNPLSYDVGEDVTFRVTLLAGNRLISVPYCRFVFSRDSGASTELTLSGISGQFIMTFEGNKVPGCGYLEGFPLSRNGYRIASLSNVRDKLYAGVVFGFYDIEEATAKPADFDRYWDGEMEKLLSTEPEAEVFELCPYCSDDDFDVYNAYVKAADGFASLHISVPKNAQEKSLPISVTLHGYSTEADSTPADKSRSAISICVNRFCVENHMTDEYYAEKTEENSGYMFSELTNGMYEGYRMIIRDIQGIRFTEKQFSDIWDGENIKVSGGSMGGFRTIAAAGLYDHITYISPGIPWMCDLDNGSAGRLPGWRPGYNDTTRYYDSCYFAQRVKADVSISFGLADYTCPPSGVIAMYNNISSDKVIHARQSSSHGSTNSISGTYTVSSADPEFVACDTVIVDSGCAVKETEQGTDERILTTNEKALKKTVDSLRGIQFISLQYTEDLTAETVGEVLLAQLTAKGLPADTVLEFDEDNLYDAREQFRSVNNNSSATVGIYVRVYTSDLEGYYERTFQFTITRIPLD